MREIEARIFDAADDARTFNAESGCPERQPRHVFEGHAVDALLVEVVHVLPVGLAVGDDVETQTGLIGGCPANHLVGFFLAERRLFHRVRDLRGARIAADYRVAISIPHDQIILKPASARASLI
jgi:hypothetical protein